MAKFPKRQILNFIKIDQDAIFLDLPRNSRLPGECSLVDEHDRRRITTLSLTIRCKIHTAHGQIHTAYGQIHDHHTCGTPVNEGPNIYLQYISMLVVGITYHFVWKDWTTDHPDLHIIRNPCGLCECSIERERIFGAGPEVDFDITVNYFIPPLPSHIIDLNRS